MNFNINLKQKIINLIIFIFILLKNQNKDNNLIKKEFNYYNTNNKLNYFINNDTIHFNISDINFLTDIKRKIIKIKYKILICDKNENFILPSDLALFNNIHLICAINLINEKIVINSIPSISQNQYYECIEFIKLKEKIKIGIIIYQTNQKEVIIESFKTLIFLNISFKIRELKSRYKGFFDPLIISKQYIRLSKIIKENKTLRLKQSYMQYPINCLKREITIYENNWYFKNINNIYFCFCKGLYCFGKNNYKKCKYNIYLNIIDKNRKVYKKEDYIFLDFIFNEYSSDDTYPIFKQMLKDKKSVHYITENMNIYKEYCCQKIKCFDIIYVNKNNYTIDSDFLEKYLTLILKLQQVISGAGLYQDKLFYNIEYITYICVGHGVSFFKYFLYDANNWYGYKLYDKILIPPSNKLIFVAKIRGWKEENIIKINLPRWDKYNFNYYYKNKSNINNNSIFIMFTWRKMKKDHEISSDYFKNILDLINNPELYLYLKSKNIILYFSLHHRLIRFKYKFRNGKYIYFIEENIISECLSKTNLVVSDFSSIIFDVMYRRKPYIIYIPDANDQDIQNIYEKNYYEVIESLKNDSIYFENKFFNIKEVVKKIKYYIDNNFRLESHLEKFYDSFEIKIGNNTNEFIKFITNSI